MVRLALLVLAVAVAAPQTVQAAPDASAHAAARKPKKSQTKEDKKRARRRERRERKKRAEAAARAEAGTGEIEIVRTDPPTPGRPSTLALGEIAITTPVPEPPYVAGDFTSTKSSPSPRRKPSGAPTWFFGVRAGPALIDRRGYYNFRSNRQTYHDERNARAEVALGRYLGRHFSLGVVGGSGPYPKFDEPDPLFGENTRFSVYLMHARLDLDLHAGAFVLGIGGGGAYEYTTGSFETQDPTTLEISMHTATFKRFGLVGAARTGLQVSAGPFAFELLAEATVLKLFRGTYDYAVVTEGPSDRELGYVGSLLLGVRLQ